MKTQKPYFVLNRLTVGACVGTGVGFLFLDNLLVFVLDPFDSFVFPFDLINFSHSFVYEYDVLKYWRHKDLKGCESRSCKVMLSLK